MVFGSRLGFSVGGFGVKVQGLGMGRQVWEAFLCLVLSARLNVKYTTTPVSHDGVLRM